MQQQIQTEEKKTHTLRNTHVAFHERFRENRTNEKKNQKKKKEKRKKHTRNFCSQSSDIIR